MAKSNKTKAELEKENTTLKDKLKEFAQKVKLDKGTADYTDKAFGLYKKDGKFMFAHFVFNAETGDVKIAECVESSRIPEAAHMCEMEAKRLLSERMSEVVDEKSEV